MNTHPHIENTYYHDLVDDKSYFGGFFNLAQKNIESVFEEFCLRLSLQSSRNVLDFAEQYFLDKISYSDWQRRINVLTEYFPIIEYLDLATSDERFKGVAIGQLENEKRKYFRDSLKSLIKLISDLRHFYTHYHHSPITINSETYALLDDILLKVAKQLRKKKMKNDKTKEILKERIQSEFKILLQQKIEQLKKLKQEGKKVNLSDKEAIGNSIFNDAFQHILFKDKDNFSLKDYYKSLYPVEELAENGAPISRNGLVFLLSCFLGKKETELLKSNTFGFKAKVQGEHESISKKHNSLKFMATQWVFSYLAFKGLKRRMNNQYNALTLLTQMIDELSKVPDSVYQTFSEKDKEEFLEDMNEFVQTPDGEANTLEGATVVHPVIRKRYENKFAYFAIRFLDEFANFPSLKFQIYSGNFQHDKRDKTIKGSLLSSDRIIKERINVFGKLSDVVKYKNDYFQNKPDTAWELFPNPNYNIIANNVHVYLDFNDSKLKTEIENIRKGLNPKTRGKNRITKVEIVNEIYGKEQGISYQEPTALLSLNELNSLLYEFLVNKKTGQELENILVEKLKEHIQLVKDYMPGDEVSNSKLPKKLKKASENQQNYDLPKLLRAIEQEIKLTNDKQLQFKKNEKELNEIDPKTRKDKRKYVFYSREKGEEARWIANDLVRWMPKKAKENWKGYQHSELQRLLAFYDIERNTVKELLSSDVKIGDFKMWGDDLQMAFNKTKFEEFYKIYLTIRMKIFIDLRGRINNVKDDPKGLKIVLKEAFIVFSKRFYVINNMASQKKELLAKPIVLPRGIFDEKPTFVLGEKIETAPHLFADWYQYCYLSTHQFQKFYQMRREYVILFEKQKLEKTDFKENKKKLSHYEAFQLFKMKQDLLIKKQMHQDLFIKLMADYLFVTEFVAVDEATFEFTLRDLYQTKSERTENQIKANLQKDRLPNDYSENVFNNNFIWNKTMTYSLFNGQLIAPEIQLKNIGKFKSLEKDSKVQQILSYDSSKKWTKLELEDELTNKTDSYERIRRNYLLKSVQLLEKEILSSFSLNNIHPMELEINGNPSFRMYIANGILKNRNEIPKHDLDWLINLAHFEEVGLEEILKKDVNIQKAFVLILIRNKFGHNQLPDKSFYQWMTEYLEKEKDETYAKYFYRVFEWLKEELYLKSELEFEK